jgi:hypothetical protein
MGYIFRLGGQAQSNLSYGIKVDTTGSGNTFVRR